MPFSQGTVAEYDILTLITEQAINSQLKQLYWTEVDGLHNPLPFLDENGEVLSKVPRKRYLIDHDLTINDVEDGEVNTEAGIFGHIDSPTISFPAAGTARLTFRFGALQLDKDGQDEGVLVPNTTEFDAEVGQMDSALVSQKIVKKTIVGVKKNLNGFSMSFDANLDRRDFQDFTEEIIKPVTSESSPLTLPVAASDKLQELSPKIFMISTIFCTFQSGQIASNFSLRGPDGKEWEGEGRTKIMDHVSDYFSRLSKQAADAKQKGLPTPQNPYVLGYGIAQDLKKVEDIDKKLNTEKTPRYFVPKTFGLAASVKPPSLNFGLLTFRDDRNGERKIGDDDLNAGKPDRDYFADAKTTPTLHDGLMVVSKGVFSDLFMKEKFLIAIAKEPKECYASILNAAFNDVTFTSKSEDIRLSYGHARKWTWNTAHANRGRPFENLFFNVRSKAEGRANISVVAYSDSNPREGTPQSSHGGWTGAADDPRRVYLRVRTFQYIKIVDEQDNFDILFRDNYSEKRKCQVWTCFDYYVEVRSGKGGSWSMEMLENEDGIPKLPKADVENKEGYVAGLEVKKSDKEPEVKKDSEGLEYMEPGIYLTTWHADKSFMQFLKEQYLPFLEKFFPAAALEKMFDPDFTDPKQSEYIMKTMAAASDNITSQASTLGNALDGMKMTIMLPAGQAFTFNGVDIDTSGNLVSHINYDTPTSGQRTTKVSHLA